MNGLNTLYGKVVVVTGANTGIGKYTVKEFFQRGARVILACRNIEKAGEAVANIREQCVNIENVGELETVKLDLNNLTSVRECAEHLLQTESIINFLINNAGVMMCPYSKTTDGFETQFATNHLGHFLFTLLLMPKFIRSTPVRIINVSSRAHVLAPIDVTDLNWEKRKYSPIGAYSQSKLANILFAKELARKLKENNIQGINTYSLHPGVIKTELSRHINKSMCLPGGKWLWNKISPYIVKNPELGVQTTIYCAISEKCSNETGLYYSDCRVSEPSLAARDANLARNLWNESLKLVGLGEEFNPFRKDL